MKLTWQLVAVQAAQQRALGCAPEAADPQKVIPAFAHVAGCCEHNSMHVFLRALLVACSSAADKWACWPCCALHLTALEQRPLLSSSKQALTVGLAPAHVAQSPVWHRVAGSED